MVDLGSGQLSPEAKYGFEFVGGKIVAKVSFAGAELGASLVVEYDALKLADALVDAIEKAIPGDQAAMAAMVKDAISLAVKQGDLVK